MDLTELTTAARAGDLAAYGRLIVATQAMVYAVTYRVLGNAADARDATQEAYVRAFRGLPRLLEPAAFPGYLRRTAIRVAHDMRRARRTSFVSLGEHPELPVLDEREQRWSEAQRVALARALLTLTAEERVTCDRFYHGGWSIARLAAEAGATEATMRKRLQRIRDQLRKEIEMSEQNSMRGEVVPADLPARIVELLARPKLDALPENPVGKVVDLLRAQFADYDTIEVPEVVDLAAARARLACDPVYVPLDKIFQLEDGRILRYDLTLPLLVSVAGRGGPLRLLASGKVYRDDEVSATRLAAFHQFELLLLERTPRADPWALIGRVLSAIEAIVPGAVQRVSPSEYPFCSRAWDIGVDNADGENLELLGVGVYLPDVVRLLGGDPARDTAIGLGLGLERLASLHIGVSDIRTIEVARV
jgi:RNA polymerase sigma-70 factor (ECF subfamily)